MFELRLQTSVVASLFQNLRMECGRGLHGRKTHSMEEWQHDIKRNTLWDLLASTNQVAWSRGNPSSNVQAPLHFCHSDINKDSYAGDFSSEIAG